MGKPIRLLAEKWFSGSPLYHNLLRIEQCEYMHIHWRDLRVLLTVEQFKEFANLTERVFEKWDGKLTSNEDILLESVDIPESIIFEGKGTASFFRTCFHLASFTISLIHFAKLI